MSHPWFDAASIICAVRKSLTTESVKTLVHSLIASRLDYCNSVFYQLSAANLQALQSVLNAGARLIMRKRKYDHITSTLCDDLHWLPIRQRILYKLYTIVYKCIHECWRKGGDRKEMERRKEKRKSMKKEGKGNVIIRNFALALRGGRLDCDFHSFVLIMRQS